MAIPSVQANWAHEASAAQAKEEMTEVRRQFAAILDGWEGVTLNPWGGTWSIRHMPDGRSQIKGTRLSNAACAELGARRALPDARVVWAETVNRIAVGQAKGTGHIVSLGNNCGAGENTVTWTVERNAREG